MELQYQTGMLYANKNDYDISHIQLGTDGQHRPPIYRAKWYRKLEEGYDSGNRFSFHYKNRLQNRP